MAKRRKLNWRKDLEPVFQPVAVIALLVIAAITFRRYDAVQAWKLHLISLSLGAVIAGFNLYLRWPVAAKSKERKTKVLIGEIIPAMLMIVLSLGLGPFFNCMLDFREARTVQAEPSHIRHVSDSFGSVRDSAWIAHVSIPEGSDAEVEVSRELADQIEPGKTPLVLSIKPGLLGVEWIQSVELKTSGAGVSDK